MKLLLGVSVATIAAVAIATGASGNPGMATKASQAAKPTLAVAIVGPGRVTSRPAGISCPGKCSATYAAGSRVTLTQKPKGSSRFLRWGGACTGARACRVRVSGLTAVAAQFAPGSKPAPTPPTSSSVEPGTYQGSGGLRLYVPAGGRSVLNFSTSYVGVRCAGGGGHTPQLRILKATIGRGRSFTAKASESAVVDGANATTTYTATGRFQGRDSAGRMVAAGVYRVDTAFTDTPNRRCTSNDQPWEMVRVYPAPTTTSVQPGTYRGSGGLSLSVPAGGGSVLNFTTSYVGVRCAGGGGHTPQLKILKATIGPDRSFTAKASETAVVNGANATITYTATGYFQGPDSAGRTIASGVYRVDSVFTDTPSRRCTSNDQPWDMTRTGA